MIQESNIIDLKPAQDLIRDLVSVFSLLETDIYELMDKSIKENWTYDQLINEILRLVEE